MASPLVRAAHIVAGVLAGSLVLAGCSLSSDDVSCSGTKCTVTLKGDGASADILGQKLELAGTKDGRATLGAGGATVSCAQGESVKAGPLSVTCTSVTDDAVKVTASLG